MGEDGGENGNCGGIKERVVRQGSMERVEQRAERRGLMKLYVQKWSRTVR